MHEVFRYKFQINSVQLYIGGSHILHTVHDIMMNTKYNACIHIRSYIQLWPGTRENLGFKFV